MILKYLRRIYKTHVVFFLKKKLTLKKNRSLHPGRLTWNLQITHLDRNMIFQASMIMFHVNLQGCRRRLDFHSDMQ